jgi:hypothetical protein
VIVNEEETNRELCFGALHTKVLAHREPEIPPKSIIFENRWPKIPCTITRRRGSKDTIIRVAVENSTSTFGMLANESAGAIAALYDGLAGGSIRFQCHILPQAKKPENGLGHLIFEFEVILYGKPSLFQNVGNLLSAKNMYLQQPLEYDKHTRYQNPHYYVKHQRAKTGVLQQPRFQDVARTAEEIQQDIDSVFDKLMATEAKLPEKEAPDSIITPLYGPHKNSANKDTNIRNKLCTGLQRGKLNLPMMTVLIIHLYGELDRKLVKQCIITSSPIKRRKPNHRNQEEESLQMMYRLLLVCD